MTETGLARVRPEMSAEEVIAAESELRRTVLERDVDALERLLADDVLFVGPDGSTVYKATDLEIHRSGAMRIVRYDPVDDSRVDPVADGVFRLLITVDVAVEMGDGRHEGRYLYTCVYALRDGRPQIVLAQAVPAQTL